MATSVSKMLPGVTSRSISNKPVPCQRAQPSLRARAHLRSAAHAASFQGSINGSVDTFDYISYVLNNEPLLSGPPEGCASNYTQGDVVVARTVEEVEE